jgi:Fur family transcriptional regulator, peroxide stress response regulator
MESLPLNHQDLQMIIEKAGLRCTPQRLAVYEQLSQSTEHPTAEDVYQAVRSRIPRISLATVYKALEALVAVGVAAKLTSGTGGARSRYDARRDLHYHFRCLRSGTVHDLPTRFDPDLLAKLDPRLHEDLGRRGFQVTGYRLELVGYQIGPLAGTLESSPREPNHPAASSQEPASSPARGAVK